MRLLQKLAGTPTIDTCFTCGGHGHRVPDCANRRRRSPTPSFVLSIRERVHCEGMLQHVAMT